MTDNETVYITSNVGHKRRTFDEETFKKEEPTVYAACQKTTFSTDMLKKLNQKLYNKFLFPEERNGHRTWDVRVYDKELGITTRRVTTRTSVEFKSEKGLKL